MRRVASVGLWVFILTDTPVNGHIVLQTQCEGSMNQTGGSSYSDKQYSDRHHSDKDHSSDPCWQKYITNTALLRAQVWRLSDDVMHYQPDCWSMIFNSNTTFLNLSSEWRYCAHNAGRERLRACLLVWLFEGVRYGQALDTDGQVRAAPNARLYLQ